VSVADSGPFRAQLLFGYSLNPHTVVLPHCKGLPPPGAAVADSAGSSPGHGAELPVEADPNAPLETNCVAETIFKTELLPEDEWQWGEMRG
jgi:hypothetical protein